MARTPNPEEWRQIQGGEPTILESPSSQLFEIVHAYPQPDGAFEGPLAVVPTPREQLLGTTLVHFSKDVVAPAALLWRHHGQPCEARSGRANYQRLTPDMVDTYVKKRMAEGWKQRSLNLTPNPPR